MVILKRVYAATKPPDVGATVARVADAFASVGEPDAPIDFIGRYERLTDDLCTALRLAGERDSLNVVDDQLGCQTFTGHLARALLTLTQDPVPGILHVAGAGSCSWYEFATEIVAAAGADCEVSPIATAEYPPPARRPAYSVLESERGAPELPPWRAGLAQFMAERAEVAA